MIEKSDYLKQYRSDVEIVNYDKFLNINLSFLPDQWKKIFNSKNDETINKEIISFWKEKIGHNMNNTISHLEDNLVKAEIIKSREEYSVLYTIKSLSGEINYYEGKFPKEKFENIKLNEKWELVPDKLKRFYEEIHNGFYHYSSISMGLMPLEDVILLEDYEWGILDELEEPLQIDLACTFGFFENGSGDCVAVDLENSGIDKGVLWFHDDQPDYNINFWDVVDEWINIGLEM
ncbi:SMI1/KNR4 family protein [Sebaldella sp. S0638]|uniref:SMI1/KNR4 family protein n=1 Tax=Sebaldella sp. S0638 TaxID=2957809 RepID=UPI00209E1972|nr:SMI1/KNR4 family protein [Sebaldella sp. S0638]MCP1222967.1 SMI1/KNR4 family protein [Sebaldella sp. S0638]